MIVKIKCKNCGYIKEVREDELELYNECPICGYKFDLIDVIKVYKLYESFKKLGIERTLEIINSYDFLKRFYKDLIEDVLKRRL